MSTYVRVLIGMTSVKSGWHRVSQDLFALKKNHNDNPEEQAKCIILVLDYEEGNKNMLLYKKRLNYKLIVY